MEADEKRILLAEQHRNTRHDAIDKMNEIRARWAERYDFSIADAMLNEITGAIMNLKQREPVIATKPTIDNSENKSCLICFYFNNASCGRYIMNPELLKTPKECGKFETGYPHWKQKEI